MNAGNSPRVPLSALEGGAASVVLCPTAHLADDMRRLHGQAMHLSGHATWQSLEASTPAQWLERLCAAALLRGEIPVAAAPRMVLTLAQERRLWERAIAADVGESAPLFDLDGMAATAIEADRVQREWRLRFDDDMRTPETEAFGRWQGEVAASCRRQGWLTPSQAVEWRIDCLQRGVSGLPAIIGLAGFVGPDPQRDRLLKIVRDRGVRVIELDFLKPEGVVPRVAVLADEEAECRAAADWAASWLKRSPGARLRIAVADFGRLQPRLTDLLDRTLHPDWVGAAWMVRERAWSVVSAEPLERAGLGCRYRRGRCAGARRGGFARTPAPRMRGGRLAACGDCRRGSLACAEVGQFRSAADGGAATMGDGTPVIRRLGRAFPGSAGSSGMAWGTHAVRGRSRPCDRGARVPAGTRGTRGRGRSTACQRGVARIAPCGAQGRMATTATMSAGGGSLSAGGCARRPGGWTVGDGDVRGSLAGMATPEVRSTVTPTIPAEFASRLKRAVAMPGHPEWQAPAGEEWPHRLEETTDPQAATLGSLAHACLEQVATTGQLWDAGDLSKRIPVLAGWLGLQGWPSKRASAGTEQVVRWLDITLRSADGQWVLKPRPGAVSELALSKVGAGDTAENAMVVTRVIDRSFVEEGVRWIADHKTAELDGAGEAALAAHAEGYRRQLEGYAALFAGEDLPVRTGVFYLAHGRLVPL